MFNSADNVRSGNSGISGMVKSGMSKFGTFMRDIMRGSPQSCVPGSGQTGSLVPESMDGRGVDIAAAPKTLRMDTAQHGVQTEN